MRIVRHQETVEQSALLNYIYAEEAADRAIELLKEAKLELLAEMRDQQRKTMKLTKGDRVFTATYTQRKSFTLNEDGLRKAIGARLFNKFTVRKLDKKLLEKAMTEGTVDPVIVAKYTEEDDTQPYLTYRVKDAEEDEAPSL